MKKLYTTTKYKKRQKRRIEKIKKKIKNKLLLLKKTKGRATTKYNKKKEFNIKPPIYAPSKFRLIEDTEGCLLFFRNIRNEDYISSIGEQRFVIISLKNVVDVDYGTISILTAIRDDLKFKGIMLRGEFPEKTKCKEFIIESGFLNHMYDSNGKPFPKSNKSDFIFFEKGCGILSNSESMKISTMVKNVVNHLIGENKHCQHVKTIILEICGNSIEWGGTQNKQWLLGIKYETGKVIFTVTDVGKGILERLHRNFNSKVTDFFSNKSNADILKGAFVQKYGSTTMEENRNKGLPSVKENFDKEKILNLKVLTNNVILHFDNHNLSKTFGNGSPRFKGTFYQWEITQDCLNKQQL